MKLTETRISGETIYDGKIITVKKDIVELENGKNAAREVVCHPGGVCIAALDAHSNTFLVRQLRYPYGEVLAELPAGKLDKGTGENPLQAGKRELLEETGIVADCYYKLGQLYPTPGYCDEIIYLYAATDLRFQSQNLDDDEFLEVIKIPLDEAVKLVLNNEIKDAKTQVCLLKLKMMIDGDLLQKI